MKSFDGGLLEIALLTAFFVGVFGILCAIICIAILLVLHVLEEVDYYKRNNQRWRK